VSERHGDNKQERLRALCTPEVFGALDVVCLQEVFAVGSCYARELLDSARALGFGYHVWPSPAPICSLSPLGNGLMVLSRVPIVASRSMRFTSSVYADRLACKGAVYVHLRPGGPETDLHVFNVHLQSFYSEVDQGARIVQREQLQELMTWIEEIATDGAPVVICGDFNLDANDPSGYDIISNTVLQRGFVDALGDPSTSVRAPTCHIYYDVLGRECGTHRRDAAEMAKMKQREAQTSLDYVFFRPGVTQVCRELSGNSVGETTPLLLRRALTPRKGTSTSAQSCRLEDATVRELSDSRIPMGFLSDHAAIECVLNWGTRR
jgi:endonuclease/exonuclease/phosphatase family metal-dependent hydrolase